MFRFWFQVSYLMELELELEPQPILFCSSLFNSEPTQFSLEFTHNLSYRAYSNRFRVYTVVCAPLPERHEFDQLAKDLLCTSDNTMFCYIIVAMSDDGFAWEVIFLWIQRIFTAEK